MPGLERVYQQPEPVSSQSEHKDRLAKAYIPFQTRWLNFLGISKDGNKLDAYLLNTADKFQHFWDDNQDFQQRAADALDNNDKNELKILFKEVTNKLKETLH